MRVLITFLSAALLLPSCASARFAAKIRTIRTGPSPLVAPVAFDRISLRTGGGVLTVPSIAGTLPTLEAPVLPVAADVGKAVNAVTAVPAPVKRKSTLTVLRSVAKQTQKKKKNSKKAAALGGMFDGGSKESGISASWGSFSPSHTGLGVPTSFNAADSAFRVPAPVFRPVAGSIFSRVRRPWLGPLKAFAFRAWSEIQRIRHGKPRLRIEDADYDDLERLVEITDYSRLGNHQDDPAQKLNKSGFLAWTYSIEFFQKYLEHPDARILIARDRQGKIQGFMLVYGKGVIEPGHQSQEFNLLARLAVEKAYGPNAEFLLAKLMASDPRAPRGTGRQISNYMIAEMLEHGIDLIATTLVNDEPLRGTRFDIPESKLLHNNASGNLAKQVHGRRVASGFMYGHTKEQFDRDISGMDAGIHAFDMYALSLNKKRPFPKVAVPKKNQP